GGIGRLPDVFDELGCVYRTRYERLRGRALGVDQLAGCPPDDGGVVRLDFPQLARARGEGAGGEGDSRRSLLQVDLLRYTALHALTHLVADIQVRFQIIRGEPYQLAIPEHVDIDFGGSERDFLACFVELARREIDACALAVDLAHGRASREDVLGQEHAL